MQQNKDRQATELSALILFGVVINSLVHLEILQSIEYCLIIFFPHTSMESHESFLNQWAVFPVYMFLPAEFSEVNRTVNSSVRALPSPN